MKYKFLWTLCARLPPVTPVHLCELSVWYMTGFSAQESSGSVDSWIVINPWVHGHINSVLIDFLQATYIKTHWLAMYEWTDGCFCAKRKIVLWCICTVQLNPKVTSHSSLNLMNCPTHLLFLVHICIYSNGRVHLAPVLPTSPGPVPEACILLPAWWTPTLTLQKPSRRS